MKKQHVWPEGHWNWPIKINHKHGVRCSEMMWVGGQVDLSPQGEVLNFGDLNTQTRNVMNNFDRVLGEMNSSLNDLVSLNCFYVNDGSVDEKEFLQQVAAALPDGSCTAVTAIPIPYLAYDGMLVEIEGVVMSAEDGSALERNYCKGVYPEMISEKFCSGLQCEEMIYVSSQCSFNPDGALINQGSILKQTNQVMSHIESTLKYFGAGFDDVVKINRWYAGGDALEDFEPAALACAANFSEPGPAATGIPLPRHGDPDMLIKIGVIAMLGKNGEHLPRRHVWPESLWDWHVHLPYQHGLKCGRMIFLGGQVSIDKKGRAVHPGELTPQTHQAMAHIKTILNELGADFDDVTKVMTVYQGDCGPEALNDNLPIRSSYFNDPGPATTGVPLPVLAYEGMCIEIDIYAMADAD